MTHAHACSSLSNPTSLQLDRKGAQGNLVGTYVSSTNKF